jgi:hypothetical protein
MYTVGVVCVRACVRAFVAAGMQTSTGHVQLVQLKNTNSLSSSETGVNPGEKEA